MNPSRALRGFITTVTVLVMTQLAGCGLLWDTATEGPDTAPPEKSTIKVGALRLVDSIPMLLAIDNGFFADEGLTVQFGYGEKGSANLKEVMAGRVDLGLTSFPPPIKAQLDGARLKVVATAVQTTPNLIPLVVDPDGPITSLTDLGGKKIAVSSPGGISEMTLNAHFALGGIDPDTVEYVSMEIAAMPEALSSRQVDAAIIAQPHVQSALRAGAEPIFDPFSGATADFLWSGFIATQEFTEQNPNTVAAFQRALNRAVLLTEDRSKVEQSAMKHLSIDQNTAAVMDLPVFPTTVDTVHLQRVADMMHESGAIPTTLDMSEMAVSSRQ